mmetsp:Transcript_7560/g.28419  ORF Transcript_7560/g.28419 Transcript_7560/m.28419 type:complete len:204 (+) Transcript_7560:341-952(+)
MGTLCCLVWIIENLHVLLYKLVLAGGSIHPHINVVASVHNRLQIGPDLILRYFWIVYSQISSLIEQVLGNKDGARLTSVTSVGLEGKSKDGNLFVSDCVKHFVNDFVGKTLTLKVIDLNHSIKVVCNLLESIVLAQVDEIQNILLEARSTESHRRLQELGSNSGVVSNSTGHLRNICSSALAQCGNGIDRRDTLCQKCICHKL